MDELGIKTSATTVITVPYFVNQNSVQKKIVTTSLPPQAKLLQNK